MCIQCPYVARKCEECEHKKMNVEENRSECFVKQDYIQKIIIGVEQYGNNPDELDDLIFDAQTLGRIIGINFHTVGEAYDYCRKEGNEL